MQNEYMDLYEAMWSEAVAFELRKCRTYCLRCCERVYERNGIPFDFIEQAARFDETLKEEALDCIRQKILKEALRWPRNPITLYKYGSYAKKFIEVDYGQEFDLRKKTNRSSEGNQ